MTESFAEFLDRRENASHAYIRGDAGPLDSMLTEHEPATFLPPSGAVISGVENTRTAQVHGAAAFGEDGRGHFEVVAQGSDDTFGYWTGRQVATVSMGGGDPMEMVLRVTELFRVEDGQWRLVHRHADVVDG